jgi:oxygen-independent coproporphyrinogen-3 oxidase
MVKAICREIELQKNYLSGEINTIYFGGGTPSLLNDSEIRQVLDKIRQVFEVNPQAEITLEANPDDLSLEKLQELWNAGINRLSIGLQSFHEPHLRWMNRAHSREEGITCVENARKVGFESISLDLIYGIPDNAIQTNDNFENPHAILQADMEMAISLKPTHISAYCLTIEPQTVFGKWEKVGKLPEIDEEFSAQQFELLVSFLAGNGFEQYEISNFAKSNQHSQHNTNYWRGVPYLGVGPSAHSFNQTSRQFNVRNNAKYLKAISKNKVPFEVEQLTQSDQINEYLMTALRTKWGVDLNWLQNNCNFDMLDSLKKEVDFQLQQETIFVEANCLKLTPKGKLLADGIAASFFVD